MFGIGPTELVLIAAIALLLFGAPVLTFIFGYALGKKKAAGDAGASAQAGRPVPTQGARPAEQLPVAGESTRDE